MAVTQCRLTLHWSVRHDLEPDVVLPPSGPGRGVPPAHPVGWLRLEQSLPLQQLRTVAEGADHVEVVGARDEAGGVGAAGLGVHVGVAVLAGVAVARLGDRSGKKGENTKSRFSFS